MQRRFSGSDSGRDAAQATGYACGRGERTAGGLADRITGVAGASDYSWVGSSPTRAGHKDRNAGCRSRNLQRCGPVSQEVAEAMAQGAAPTGATYALSITGNAGPTTDGNQAPVGMVYAGLGIAFGDVLVHAPPVPRRSRHNSRLCGPDGPRLFATEPGLKSVQAKATPNRGKPQTEAQASAQCTHSFPKTPGCTLNAGRTPSSAGPPGPAFSLICATFDRAAIFFQSCSGKTQIAHWPAGRRCGSKSTVLGQINRSLGRGKYATYHGFEGC